MKKLTRKGAWYCIKDALSLISFYPLITVALVTTHFSVLYFAPNGSVLMIELMLCLIIFKLGLAFYKNGDLKNAPAYIKTNIDTPFRLLGMLAAFAAILVSTDMFADTERGLASYLDIGRFTPGLSLGAFTSVLFVFANHLTIIGYCHVYDEKKNERRKKRIEQATLLVHGAQ